MATVIFECLRKANIAINTLKHTSVTKAVIFFNIRSRCSFRTFKTIPGTTNIIESLKDFRKRIEDYAYELQKY